MLIRDLSHHDNPEQVDYNAYDGFIVKATEGTGYVDPALETHIANIRKAGKPFSLFHYLSFQSDINAQIADFKTQFAKYPDASLLNAVDVEEDKTINAKIPDDLISRVTAALNGISNSMLYCNRDMLKRLGEFRPGTPLWIALPGGNLPQSFNGFNTIGVQYNDPKDPEDLSNFTEDIFMNKSPTVLQIDSARPNKITVNGWVNHPSGINRVEIYAENESNPRVTATLNVDRPDVASHFSNHALEKSGFTAEVPLDCLSFPKKFIVLAFANDGTYQRSEFTV